ncbi:MAG: amidohydrolase [Gammaproteobacteria bacterium]|nr:MAG: amidohydrolase [Gammaproteobacteria bacterium]|tara:strand:+ start:108 stop:995 length:888 start_codon:yes stop_codon:yes gene_type:complete
MAMTENQKLSYKAIDAVVNIWTREALSHRPDWGDEFFVGKMNAENDLMAGLSLEEIIEKMEEAGIDKAFLIAARAGRVGLPGCYHMPYSVVADACAKYPERFYGLAGIDPFEGMDGVRAFEDAIKNMGFVGAHLYPHWYELAPDHAKYYPFYAKCCELNVPIQMQVGQSMVYSQEYRTKSVGQPIALDAVACDFPELKLIGIHVGIPWHDEMISMAWKHENIFIGCDAHRPKYWPKSFIHYLNSYGQDKIIFGTDFPVLEFKKTIDDIDALGLKSEVRKKLLRDNVIRVYGLDFE